MDIDLLCPHCGYSHNMDDVRLGCSHCHGNFTASEGYKAACDYVQSIVQTPEPVADNFMFAEVPIEHNPIAQRIAALEAELTEYKAVVANMSDVAEIALADRQRLLALVRDLSHYAIANHSGSGSSLSLLWQFGEQARALLAELEGGNDE